MKKVLIGLMFVITGFIAGYLTHSHEADNAIHTLNTTDCAECYNLGAKETDSIARIYIRRLEREKALLRNEIVNDTTVQLDQNLDLFKKEITRLNNEKDSLQYQISQIQHEQTSGSKGDFKFLLNGAFNMLLHAVLVIADKMIEPIAPFIWFVLILKFGPKTDNEVIQKLLGYLKQ